MKQVLFIAITFIVTALLLICVVLFLERQNVVLKDKLFKEQILRISCEEKWRPFLDGDKK